MRKLAGRPSLISMPWLLSMNRGREITEYIIAVAGKGAIGSGRC
jgi:hypothetical protein